LGDPGAFVQAVRQSRLRADILTFVQAVDDPIPRFAFHQEPDRIAVLSITTYDEWLKTKLYNKPRNMLRKALKSGIEVRLEDISDSLLSGVKAIYDESPLRQGKRNYHYMEDFDTIKREHSTFLDRSQFITVHYSGEMIGFAKVTFSQGCGFFMNFLSKVSHRDKAVNNAIVAKAVEICAARQVTRLVYGVWGSEGTKGLVDFKTANGFECVEVPRYFVPLTRLGRLALRAGLHRGHVRLMPKTLIAPAARVRTWWNTITVRPAKKS
jgi:hypothetical protein